LTLVICIVRSGMFLLRVGRVNVLLLLLLLLVLLLHVILLLLLLLLECVVLFELDGRVLNYFCGLPIGVEGWFVVLAVVVVDHGRGFAVSRDFGCWLLLLLLLLLLLKMLLLVVVAVLLLLHAAVLLLLILLLLMLLLLVVMVVLVLVRSQKHSFNILPNLLKVGHDETVK